jgi:chorismate mutase
LAVPQLTGSLEQLRAGIDRIDRDLVQLLAERMKLAKEIGGHKKPDRIRDGKRELEILQQLYLRAAEVDCPPELVKAIYPLIFDHSIRLQLKGKGVQNEQVM